MRHVRLTCKNHPNLRWQCKSIAFTEGYGYNGARNIFFNGEAVEGKDWDFNPAAECSCKATDLILAPGEKMPTDDE